MEQREIVQRHGATELPLPLPTFVGFVAAAIAVMVIALLFQRVLDDRSVAAERVTHTVTLNAKLETLVSTVKDAETGQRGFLLTNESEYLQPYVTARDDIKSQIAELGELIGDDATQQRRLASTGSVLADKFAELEETIALQRDGKPDAALAIVRSDRGKTTMDAFRQVIGQMIDSERAQLDLRQREWSATAARSRFVVWSGSGLLLALIVIGAVMASRDYRARETQNWLRAGQSGFAARILGEQRLEALGDRVLEFLAAYLGAQVGAVHIVEDGGLRRRAAYALASDAPSAFVAAGTGLAGQAFKERRLLHVRDVPAGWLDVSTGIGRGRPAEVLVVPALVDGEVQAVVELGFFRRVDAADRDLLGRVADALGVAVRSSKDRTRLEDLLEETQRQAEELQTQQEELRVNNEELEEQGRVLREARGDLETQQAELEQTNTRLEEHTQVLAMQKELLTEAQAVLALKAGELERANQYKNEFLANMSHELRTPLNSTLILAKLLADNKQGNLTEEQVKFARTISSAGNDLLALINDILDLSKIEAGKVDVVAQPVSVAQTVESLARTFEPVAQQKRLGFSLAVEPGAPERIETDVQRLGQVLKNLVSNALKFTDRGEVSMTVRAAGDDGIAFAVRDTGIGIADSQQGLIFEAFRQADGSTHRKYGGTGLGLSISRHLAHLLGGDLTVSSAPGEGSVFTLTLPRVYAGPVQAKAAVAVPPPAAPAPRPAAPAPVVEPNDDRHSLAPGARTILVIEDDVHFSAILRDLAHEMDFQSVVTHTANEGLAAAATYRPNAILLDMNLPDHSGLGVLDQLKRDPRTRHIPVHVVSVADYSHEAMELGAIGYALKPVKREQLVDALHKLEAKFSQGQRHVLIVEDDARQRDSIRALLGTGDIRITDAPTAAAALAHLDAATFDCMVMDLNLPDMSGFDLLEAMASRDDGAFPPVIVYTGRSLSRDEEQALRRFSRSIIIKDARSPERLLDEVTLFLHQVEADLPPESQRMLALSRDRESTFEGRRVLIVEDDVRNVFALASVLEPKGAKVDIARNGIEAIEALTRVAGTPDMYDLVLMDVMMPEMDGLTAMREIRKRPDWRRLPIIALTAKAMRDDQEKCLAAGANDYIAKPLDVEKLLSLARVWIQK